MIVLQNNKLNVSIAKQGGELKSILYVKDNTELLWQGDNAVWARNAPVLFPIVGKLKHDGFMYDNQFYHLLQHGFARDCLFEVIHQSNFSVTFSLKANETTLAKYPFLFELELSYTLNEGKMEVKYCIKNTDTKTLPFSIGGHPGFKVPFYKHEKVEDYFLQFEQQVYQLTELENGLRKSTTKELKLSNAQLQLNSTLFDADALVFENSQINEVQLNSKNHSLSIGLQCQNWTHFGIWSKKGDLKFVCLEPWMGVADSVNAGTNLFEKEGIVILNPNEQKEMSYYIIIND
jgi:galactose mutarotase-like enzyme